MLLNKRLLLPCVAVVFFMALEKVRADAIFDVNVQGFQSDNLQGGAGNTVTTLLVGPNVLISDISWTNVQYIAYGPSKLNELVFSFSNSDRSSVWDFSVSIINARGTYFGSGGVADMVGVSGGPFHVLADGLLRIETYERVVDSGANAEALVGLGTFHVTGVGNTVAVPEPTSLLVLTPALGLIGFRRRRVS